MWFRGERAAARKAARQAELVSWAEAARGWHLASESVALEPPALRGMPRSRTAHLVDDARVPTLLERTLRSLAVVLRGRSSTTETLSRAVAPEHDAERRLVHLELVLPRDHPLQIARARSLAQGVGSPFSPTAWETVADGESIRTALAVDAQREREVREQVAVHEPVCLVRKIEDPLTRRWREAEGLGSIVLDFGLSESFHLAAPIASSLSPDPLAGLIGCLAELERPELAAIQVRYQACRLDWEQQFRRFLASWSAEEPGLEVQMALAQAQPKLSQSGFAVSMRVALRVGNEARAWRLAQGIWRALNSADGRATNGFIPLDPGEYTPDQQEHDLLARTSHRPGMILGLDELATLCHMPDGSVGASRIARINPIERPIPEACQQGEVLLGHSEYADRRHRVFLPPQLRTRHMHLIGASGTGKSTLMLNLALQDLRAGRGVAVLDPHGDLIDDLLAYMPDERIRDLILIDPSDPKCPITFNILKAHSELEKQLLSSDLVETFKRLSTSWGDQMTAILSNAVLAILESRVGGTLLDLRRFLVEREFRATFLETVDDEEVRYFWSREFSLISGKPQAPILTRLNTFLRSKVLRRIVAHRESNLDLRQVMDSGAVLLVRLSQGAIGEENAALLGSLLVARLQQAALSRQELPTGQRRPFIAYLDEFHNYLTPSISSILSGGRKYGLGLVLAHQDLTQLSDRSSALHGAAIANPATRVCFRLGDMDARRLAPGFEHFGAADLLRLGLGEAACRVESADNDLLLLTEPAPAFDGDAQELRARTSELANQAIEGGNPPGNIEFPAPQQDSGGEPKPAVAPRPPHEQPASVIGSRLHGDEPASESAPAPTGSPSEPGRGGPDHRTLQRQVKELAQRAGWVSKVEARTPGGLGFADVLLEREGRYVAVEIGISTDADHEIKNLRKYEGSQVAVVVVALASEPARTVVDEHVCYRQEGPEVVVVDVGSLLEALPVLLDRPLGEDERVAGYVVKVERGPPSLAADGGEQQLRELVRRLWRS